MNWSSISPNNNDYNRNKIRTNTIGDMLLCSISPNNNKIRTNTIGDMLLCSISPNYVCLSQKEYNKAKSQEVIFFKISQNCSALGHRARYRGYITCL